jgi:hypothetical protein
MCEIVVVQVPVRELDASGAAVIRKFVGSTVNLSVAILDAKDSNPITYDSSILSAVAPLVL